MPSDQDLARYLLGGLPDTEADALDERSIVDPEFAERLRRVEHDLADAYARGELSREDRVRWEELFGASNEGISQLRLAEALAMRERRSPTQAWNSASRRFVPTWMVGLAAAALIALAVGATYVFRRPAAPAASVATAPASPVTQPAPQPTPAPSLALVALTLAAPTRGVTTVPLLNLPAEPANVRVTLYVEPADFPGYSVALRDMTSRRVVWTAPALTTTSTAESRVLTFTVPGSLLHQGLFAFDVEGMRSANPEPIGSYPFRVKSTP